MRLCWSDRQIDRAWLVGLEVMAIALFTANLGGLALRDWDEGLVAQVAREIAQTPSGVQTWLYPTLWGEPYLNKPPLVHGLIALAYRMGGVHEWTARLPGALLSSLSVPLLYAVGRELFHRRLPALCASLIYLTSLAVVRNGRLAMLDGAVLCFLMVTMLGLVRSRRNSAYTLLMGTGLGLICLSKGVMVGVLAGAIALGFLAWDTPRLLRSPYLWLGLGLGAVPVACWYGAQWLHYGQALGSNLVDQSLQRIWTDVEQNGGAPWFYLLELLKYGAPWILFLPWGCKLAWENRSLSWAKLAIVWGSVYLAAISVMATKLPWYVLPLYPALALLEGAAVAELWRQGHAGIRQFPTPAYRRIWIGLFAVLAGVGWAGFVYFGWSVATQGDVQLVFGAIGLTMTAVAVLLKQQDSQFLPVLIWGTYVSLLLFVASDHWVWELAEAYPVKPVAALIQQTPANQKVYTSYAYNRPSLNFYSDRLVLPANAKQLKRIWRREASPYLLLDAAALHDLNLNSQQTLGSAEGWTLITKQ